MRLPLIPHPDSFCPAVSALTVDVQRRGDELSLRYVLDARLNQLRIPSLAPPVRADELWMHTCFEAFLRDAEGEGYREFNFAPSMQWAAYRFEGYRAQMSDADTEIGVNVSMGGNQLQLTAFVPLANASRLALTAVIEDATGQKSYWALAHAPGKPDFHHSAGFVCDLAQVERS